MTGALRRGFIAPNPTKTHIAGTTGGYLWGRGRSRPWGLGYDKTEFLFQPREAVEAQRQGCTKGHRSSATRARSAANKRIAAAEARRAKTGSSRPASHRKAGDRYTSQRLANAVRRVCIKHGIERWTPYMIRHATGTRVEKQIDFDTARKVLGQKSNAVTQRYIHSDGIAAANAMQQLG